MACRVESRKTSRVGWSHQTASYSASTGNYQKAVVPPVTQSGTSAQAVEKPITGHKDVLKRRKREPLTPYIGEAWKELLRECGLERRYPFLVQGIAEGFDMGIPHITCTYIPLNHPSIVSLPDVYKSSVNSKCKTGRYIGPFTRRQLESALGPFQTSPLSLVPKTSKPGVF